MLRYIYFLCFLVDLELVFCYNSIRSGKTHRNVARVRRRQVYGSEDSPLVNVDLVDFMRKPDDPEELLVSYNFDNKRLPSKDEDYESLSDTTPRMRRLRHEATANEGTLAAHQAAKHHKKSSFSMFPFFSNKNKTKPAGPKHRQRKSHPFHFFKRKFTTNLHQTTPEEKDVGSRLEPESNATPKINGTAKKRMSPHSKMTMRRAKKSFPKIIHNSRQYYANRHKKNITDLMQRAIFNDTRNDSGQDERGAYEGNSRKEKSIDDKYQPANTAVDDLLVKQKQQQKILEELENRIRESYHVLRNMTYLEN